jgi:hypothetical protein
MDERCQALETGGRGEHARGLYPPRRTIRLRLTSRSAWVIGPRSVPAPNDGTTLHALGTAEEAIHLQFPGTNIVTPGTSSQLRAGPYQVRLARGVASRSFIVTSLVASGPVGPAGPATTSRPQAEGTGGGGRWGWQECRMGSPRLGGQPGRHRTPPATCGAICAGAMTDAALPSPGTPEARVSEAKARLSRRQGLLLAAGSLVLVYGLALGVMLAGGAVIHALSPTRHIDILAAFHHWWVVGPLLGIAVPRLLPPYPWAKRVVASRSPERPAHGRAGRTEDGDGGAFTVHLAAPGPEPPPGQVRC